MSICAIVAYLTSGFMIANYGSIAIFRVLISSSVIILIAGFFNWFGDVNKYKARGAINSDAGSISHQPIGIDSSDQLGVCCFGLFEYDKGFVSNHSSLFFLSTLISWCAIMLSVVMMLFQYWKVRLVALVSVATFVAVVFFMTARRSGMPEVANAGLFIFLSNSITPDIETAMFYWYTNAEEGPQFSPQFVGYISGLAFACMFAGDQNNVHM